MKQVLCHQAEDMTQCRTFAHVQSAQAVSRCSQLCCTLADVTRLFILGASILQVQTHVSHQQRWQPWGQCCNPALQPTGPAAKALRHHRTASLAFFRCQHHAHVLAFANVTMRCLYSNFVKGMSIMTTNCFRHMYVCCPPEPTVPQTLLLHHMHHHTLGQARSTADNCCNPSNAGAMHSIACAECVLAF